MIGTYKKSSFVRDAPRSKEQMLREMREAAANTVKLIAPKPKKPKKKAKR